LGGGRDAYLDEDGGGNSCGWSGSPCRGGS